jgi:hypothetical protein
MFDGRGSISDVGIKLLKNGVFVSGQQNFSTFIHIKQSN